MLIQNVHLSHLGYVLVEEVDCILEKGLLTSLGKQRETAGKHRQSITYMHMYIRVETDCTQ